MLTETQLDWEEMKGRRGSLTHSQLKVNAFNAAYLGSFEEKALVSSVVLCGNFLALKFAKENYGLPLSLMEMGSIVLIPTLWRFNICHASFYRYAVMCPFQAAADYIEILTDTAYLIGAAFLLAAL